MVTVKIIKRVGRLPQGAIGTISNSDHENYGVGKDFEHGIIFPHKISFHHDGNEWAIENNLLELVNNPAPKPQRSGSPQLAMALN